MFQRRFLFVAVSAAAIAIIGLLVVMALNNSGNRSQVTTVITGAQIGGPFTLTNHQGRAVTEQDFKGKYMLIYFGYTFCPDVCPTSLQDMTTALEEMGSDADPITPVFITVDPERDTVDAVAEYMEAFHPRMVGLTGSVADTSKAAKAYRVYYAKIPAEEGRSENEYLMDHSSYFYLVGPDGTFRDAFQSHMDIGELVQKLKARVSS